MADASKNLTLHVATTADDSALTKTTATLRGVDAAADGLSSSMAHAAAEAVKLEAHMGTAATAAARVSATKATLASETDKASKSTSQFGQAALSAAFFADDLQYGVKGILNNIPMLAMSLGLGGGVAGVVSILAVGFSVLSEKMGWFSKEAVATTDDLKKLAGESKATADATSRAARETDAAEAALKRHTNAIRDAEEGYKKLAQQIDVAAKARETMARNALAETDADAALKLSTIEGHRAAGMITDQEAEKQSLAVKRGAEDKRHASERAEALSKEADLRSKAAAAEKAAGVSDSQASNLAAAGMPLMDEEGRKAVEAGLKNAQDRLKVAQAALASTPKTINKADGLTEGWIEEANPAYAAAQKRVEDAARARGAAGRQLDADSEARGRTGFSDGDALRAEVEKLRREAQEAREEAAAMKGEAGLIGQTQKSRDKVFGMDSQRMDIDSGTRVMEFNKRDREVEQREKEKKEREARAKIGSEGRELMRGLAGEGLLDERQTAMLTQALDRASGSQGGGQKELSEVLKKLVGYLVRDGQYKEEQARHIAAINSQLSEQRTGR